MNFRFFLLALTLGMIACTTRTATEAGHHSAANDLTAPNSKYLDCGGARHLILQHPKFPAITVVARGERTVFSAAVLQQNNEIPEFQRPTRLGSFDVICFAVAGEGATVRDLAREISHVVSWRVALNPSSEGLHLVPVIWQGGAESPAHLLTSEGEPLNLFFDRDRKQIRFENQR